MPADRPRVFFAADPQRFNVDAAAAHGQPVHLIAFREFSPLNVDRGVAAIMRGLEEQRFDPARDMVAVTGPQILVVLLVSCALARYGALFLLLWEARSGIYVPRYLVAPPASSRTPAAAEPAPL